MTWSRTNVSGLVWCIVATIGWTAPPASAELLLRTPEAGFSHGSISLAAADLVQNLEWTADKKGLVWSEDPNAVAFNVYESHGSLLPGLTGPAVDVCLRAIAQVPAAGGLTKRPAQGELIWYLVTPVGPFEERAGGRTSAGTRQVDSVGDCDSCAHDKCTTGVLLEPACDVCVASVCASDAFCCGNQWDSLCIEQVRTVCGSLSCPDSQGACAHTLCEVGVPLSDGCDSPPLDTSCVMAVCALDPTCCGTAGSDWDELCIETAQNVCGTNCN